MLEEVSASRLALLLVLTSQPWERGVEAFRNGDVRGALALEDECAAAGSAKCKTLASSMREFVEQFNRLDELNARELKKVIELDEAITSGQRSKLARTVSIKLASAYCKTGLAAMAAGQFVQALGSAGRALKVDPDNACARNLEENARQQLFAQDAGFRDERMGDFPPYEPPLVH
jgi:tetratricopeptide (TPR) repeat protein